MKKKEIRFSLRWKLTLTIMTSVLISSIIIFSVGYALYVKKANEYYHGYLIKLAETMTAFFEADSLEERLKNEEADESFLSACAQAADMGSRFELESMRLVLPEEDGSRYYMDIDLDCKGGEDLIHFSYEKLDDTQTDRFAAGGRSIPEFVYVEDRISTAYPVIKTDGRIAAYLEVGLSNRNESRFLSIFALQMFFFVCILGIVLSFGPVIITSLRVTTPIRQLSEKATQLAEAKRSSETTNTQIFQDVKTKMRSGDEIGALSRSLVKMEQDMNAYTRSLMEVTAEKERSRTELELASAIQNSQLPNIFPPFPDRAEFDIYASMQPAKSIGGDFYDFFLIDKDHLAMVMADVSGKGIPAALFMMISRMLIKNHMQEGKGPAQTLEVVNRQLLEKNTAQMFVTVWLAVLELSTGNGIAANAGHEIPIVRRAGGRYEKEIYRHSPPVASMKRAVFKEHVFHLSPGDSLFIYTDGVPEARQHGDGAFFGMERLLASLNRDPEAAPDVQITNVLSDIRSFTGEGEQFDDITMLNLLYRGNKEQ